MLAFDTVNTQRSNSKVFNAKKTQRSNSFRHSVNKQIRLRAPGRENQFVSKTLYKFYIIYVTNITILQSIYNKNH